MSGRRRSARRSTTTERFEWFDQDGNRHEYRQRVRQLTSLGVIPASDRLVDVHCAGDHFIAALVPGYDGPPLLYIPRAGGPPAAAFVLLDGQLAGALVSLDEEGEWVAPVGTPRASSTARCGECRRDYDVSAAELEEKRRTAATTRGTPRVYVR